jgi:L-fuculose-phosphate aldolase
MRALAERVRVVELCRELSRRGFLAGTGGNLALRIDAEHMAVTPSATDYHTMQPQDVSVLRIADLRQLEGALPPSVESSLHRRVLRARADCQASVHTHQPVASACTLLGRPLAVGAAGARQLLGERIALVGYAPSGTAWLAARLAAALRPDIHAYLMRNHGVLCCVRTLADVVPALEAFEAVAAQHLRERIAAQALAMPARRVVLDGILEALGALEQAHAGAARASQPQPASTS